MRAAKWTPKNRRPVASVGTNTAAPTVAGWSAGSWSAVPRATPRAAARASRGDRPTAGSGRVRRRGAVRRVTRVVPVGAGAAPGRRFVGRGHAGADVGRAARVDVRHQPQLVEQPRERLPLAQDGFRVIAQLADRFL